MSPPNTQAKMSESWAARGVLRVSREPLEISFHQLTRPANRTLVWLSPELFRTRIAKAEMSAREGSCCLELPLPLPLPLLVNGRLMISSQRALFTYSLICHANDTFVSVLDVCFANLRSFHSEKVVHVVQVFFELCLIRWLLFSGSPRDGDHSQTLWLSKLWRRTPFLIPPMRDR